MYVSWCPYDKFELWEERPSWTQTRFDEFWGGGGLLGEGGFRTLPGFSVPAVPTLWEVTAEGVKVVEP